MYSLQRQFDNLMNQMLSIPVLTDPFFDTRMVDFPLLQNEDVIQGQGLGQAGSSGSSPALINENQGQVQRQGQMVPLYSSQLIRSDIVEEPNQFKITCEVPGVPKENIKVNIENNHLTISGNKKEEKYDEKEQQGTKIRRSERFYGDFRRTFRLPTNVDPNNLEARYENGVLCLALPKVEPKQPERKEITIQ
jgi:HSP20 family protein